MKLSSFFIIFTLSLFIPLSPSLAMDKNEKIDNYLSIFKSNDIKKEKTACNELQWSGLTDTRLFDAIEKKYHSIDTEQYDKIKLDLAAYYLKALGASGQSKYRQTLQQSTESKQKKIRRHGKIALDNLENYARWNKIISQPSASDPSASNVITRFNNMINSDEWELRRIASKRIYHEHLFDEKILNTLNQKITEVYKIEISGRVAIDALNWMMKALASTGDKKYLPTLEEVSENGYHYKNKSYAQSYIQKYLN